MVHAYALLNAAQTAEERAEAARQLISPLPLLRKWRLEAGMLDTMIRKLDPNKQYGKLPEGASSSIPVIIFTLENKTQDSGGSPILLRNCSMV